jgi:O-methyltransferase
MNENVSPAAPDIAFEDCEFYHTIELPGHGLVVGPWDLRGREDAYTGHVDFSGRSVLEVGPASGGLTAYMEGRGGKITCFETAAEYGIDMLPISTVDIAAAKHDWDVSTKRVNNAWHYTKRLLNLAAEIQYGNVNFDHDVVDQFDISILGAILLMCKSPLSVVRRACLSTRSTVIVTDLYPSDLDIEGDSLMRFNPSRGTSVIAWWALSPGSVISMLQLHGFTQFTTTLHDQMHYVHANYAGGLKPIRMFTVVGSR